MDEQTLNKAIQLKETYEHYYSLANKAYNNYNLKVILDNVDVTKEIDISEIGNILYKHFIDRANKARKELEDL